MRAYECDNGHRQIWGGDDFCTTCFDAWAKRRFPLREIRMESNAPTESEIPSPPPATEEAPPPAPPAPPAEEPAKEEPQSA